MLKRAGVMLCVASVLLAQGASAQLYDPTEPRDIYFVLDGSGSITVAKWTNSVAFTKEFVRDNVPRLGTHRVGVLMFGSTVTTVVPLTLLTEGNVGSIAQTIGAAVQPKGSSYTKEAMRAVFNQFKAATVVKWRKRCVLITDGVPNPIDTQSPCTLKPSLDSWNIETVILDIGTGNAMTYLKCLVDDRENHILVSSPLGAQAEDLVARSFISCPPDLSKDGMVDDSDFSMFLASYDALVVPPADPLADFNLDGMVDDADFVIFLKYYDSLECPGRLLNERTRKQVAA